MSFASEGGHWYNIHGQPRYTYLNAKGEEKPTTLRQARIEQLAPSVTGIIKMEAAPGLERWKRIQTMLATEELQRQPNEDDNEYYKRISQKADEIAKEAREKGTALHGEIELALTQPGFATSNKAVIEACSAINKLAGDDGGVEAEKSFTSPHGFGGKVDVHQPIGTSGRGWVLDVKTKDFTAADNLKVYDNHFMQLAAYMEGLELRCVTTADWPTGYILYVSTNENHAGLTQLVEITQAQLDRGWDLFYNLLKFWQVKNSYRPSWAMEAHKVHRRRWQHDH